MTTLRRQMKNMVKNYSEAEVKVREATSNDPWGPSSTLMSEISDLTYNIVALGEVMRMIWKRLNDHGKNWRHVYKSLVLLDYLIKNGNEKVAQQCKEHIVAIQTLKDFQYMEEQKDQGASVREKAKQLVNLLRDDDRLKQERAKALRARERFAQNAMGISSDHKMIYASSGRAGHMGASSRTQGNYADPYGSAPTASTLSPDLEAVRPSDTNEEDLQIKLAIMLSQQEQEEEAQRKRADAAKLHLAMEQSEREGQPNGLVDLADSDPWGESKAPSGAGASAFKANFNDSDSDDDLFPPLSNNGNKINSSDPWSAFSNGASNGQQNGINDPWKQATSSSTSSAAATTSNPWSPASSAVKDPWGSAASTAATINKFEELDLFSNNVHASSSDAAAASLFDSNKPLKTSVNEEAANDDPFGDFFGSTSATNKTNSANTNPWNPTKPANDILSSNSSSSTGNSDKNSNSNKTRKTPESFLGENASLVNLENLIPTTNSSNNLNGGTRPKSTNPFGNVPAIGTSHTMSGLTNSSGTGSGGLTSSASSGHLNNPFMAQANAKVPTINQLQQQASFPFANGSSAITPPPLAQPLITSAPSVPLTGMMPQQQQPMPFMGAAVGSMQQPFQYQNNFPSSAIPSIFPSTSIQPSNQQTTGPSSTNPFLMM